MFKVAEKWRKALNITLWPLFTCIYMYVHTYEHIHIHILFVYTQYVFKVAFVTLFVFSWSGVSLTSMLLSKWLSSSLMYLWNIVKIIC